MANKIFFKNLEIEKGAALAPMAGLTDPVQRAIANQYGASYTISEMVSAKAIVFGDKKTKDLCKAKDRTKPYGIQLFGCEPEIFAEAAKYIETLRPDFIDINMGCPAPKIVAVGNGSALMKNLPLAEECIRQTVNAVSIPVTVKMRKGWDDSILTSTELAKRCEAAGAAAVCIHARTRQQMYTPPIDISCIEQAVNAVSIPIIGNGDIQTAAEAADMCNQTGCAMVMVGRAAIGNPWIFSQIFAILNNTDIPIGSTLKQRMDLMVQNVYQMCEEKGEDLAMRQARTISAYYLKGLRGAASLRRLATSLTYYTDIEALARLAIKENI